MVEMLKQLRMATFTVQLIIVMISVGINTSKTTNYHLILLKKKKLLN